MPSFNHSFQWCNPYFHRSSIIQDMTVCFMWFLIEIVEVMSPVIFVLYIVNVWFSVTFMGMICCHLGPCHLTCLFSAFCINLTCFVIISNTMSTFYMCMQVVQMKQFDVRISWVFVNIYIFFKQICTLANL